MGNAIEGMVPELEPWKPSRSNISSDESESDSDEETFKQKPKPIPPMKTFAGIGIQVTFHKLDAQDIHNCDIQRCSTEDRNDLVTDILAQYDGHDHLATDIFQFRKPSFKWREKALVSVAIFKKISKRYRVKALLKVENTWISTEAKLQIDCAEFTTNLTDVKYFVIMSSLKTKTFSIPPRGTNIRVDETSKLELSIPEGAVDTDQDITVQVLPPDRKAIKRYAMAEKKDDPSIVELTDCLYTNNINLKKPVTVKLPFEKTPEETEETTLVAFQMDQQKQVHMMEANVKVTLDKSVAQLEVQQLSGCCAAFVKTKCLNNRPLLEREAEIMFGTRSLATILVFKERKKTDTGYPKLWIELVDKARVEEVVTLRNEERLLEITNSRSQDISIFDGFRLRIDVTGGLQGVQSIPKNFYLMTYMEMARDHHKLFPVEKPEMSGTTWCTLRFLSDKWYKNCVHEIDLENTDSNFEKAKRKDGLILGPKVRRFSKSVEKEFSRDNL